MDLIERVQAIADKARADAERARASLAVQRAENRRRMPETAAFLDEMRKHFGKPAWFRFTEGGLTVEYGERPSWVRE